MYRQESTYRSLLEEPSYEGRMGVLFSRPIPKCYQLVKESPLEASSL